MNSIKKIYSDTYTKNITIEINCIDKCNYSCSYCLNLKDKHIRTEKYIDFNKIVKFVTWLSYKTNKHVLIILIGGEPTLHPQFIEFCEKIHTLNADIISFTNFSLSNDFFILTIQKYNIHYEISFHLLDNIRTKLFFQKLHFLKKKKLLYGINIISVLLLPAFFNSCIDVYYLLYKICNNKVRCTLLIDNLYDYNKSTLHSKHYTALQLQLYYKICNNSNLKKYITVVFDDNRKKCLSDVDMKNYINMNYKYWKCSAGKIYFTIDINGNIYSCNMNKKVIATIDNFLQIQFINTICKSDICFCEYGLPKEKIFNI